jgi:hypothetical protein
LIAVTCLGIVIAAGAGCGKKEEPAAPANSNYYTGPLAAKPKASAPVKGMQAEPGLK